MSDPHRVAAHHGFRVLLQRHGDLAGDLQRLRRRLALASEAQAGVGDAVERLAEGALRCCGDLAAITGQEPGDLCEAIVALDLEVGAYLRGQAAGAGTALAVALADVGRRDVAAVGDKAARLGELRRVPGLSVPAGFVLTAAGYRLMCESGEVATALRAAVAALRADERASLASHGEQLRRLVRQAPLPPAVEEAITQQAARLRVVAGGRWAVRSSAVGVDAAHSFAGQFDTLLNVPTSELAAAYTSVIASRFTERAIAYRLASGGVEAESPMAVLFMPMIDAVKSGVVYSRAPHDPAGATVWVTASWGLGVDVTGGGGRADLYITRRDDPGTLLETRTVDKASLLVAAGRGIERQPVAGEQRLIPCLIEFEVEAIAQAALAAERHFGEPVDLEWALDRNCRLWLLHARALTVAPRPVAVASEEEPVVEAGTTVFPGRAVGPASVHPRGLVPEAVPPGANLVVRALDRAGAQAMPRLGGLVVESRSLDPETAAVARTLRVPAVAGARGATTRLRDGELIGLDATERRVLLGAPWPELVRGTPSGVGGGVEGLVGERVVAPASLALAAGPKKASPGFRDLVEEIRRRAVTEMLDAATRGRRGRGEAARLVVDPPLDVVVLDLGDGLTGPEGDEVTLARMASEPFRALWRGVRATGLTWAAPRGTPGWLVVGAHRLSLSLPVGPLRLLLDALLGGGARRDFTSLQLAPASGRGPGASLAEFAAEVLGRTGFEVDHRAGRVAAGLRDCPAEALSRALETAGRLVACLHVIPPANRSGPLAGEPVEWFMSGRFQRLGEPAPGGGRS